MFEKFLAPSPSGKAQDFDSCITLVRIQPGLFIWKQWLSAEAVPASILYFHIDEYSKYF